MRCFEVTNHPEGLRAGTKGSVRQLPFLSQDPQIRALIFIATPHDALGCSIAIDSIAFVANPLPSLYNLNLITSFLPSLSQLHTEFLRYIQDVHIKSFNESQTTTGAPNRTPAEEFGVSGILSPCRPKCNHSELD